jgi:hypothetical protein
VENFQFPQKLRLRKTKYETPYRMRGNTIVLLPTKTLNFQQKLWCLKRTIAEMFKQIRMSLHSTGGKVKKISKNAATTQEVAAFLHRLTPYK